MEDQNAEAKLFKQAAGWVKNCETLKLSTEEKLKMYGLFKQACVGPCKTSRPSIFDMQGRYKWDAWHKLGTLSKEDAMASYLKLVTDLAPQWQETTVGEVPHEAKGQGGGVGPVISTLMRNDDAIPDEKKSMFDWCKEGNVTELAALVSDREVNIQDGDGLSMLHWACDRGHLEVAQFLVAKGAEVNLVDSESQTPLHYGRHTLPSSYHSTLPDERIRTATLEGAPAKTSLLQKCNVTVWDGRHKGAFVALDLRHNRRVMGGVTVVMSGDFRQMLPVIARGTRGALGSDRRDADVQ